MARKPTPFIPDPHLQRQHSTKSDEYYQAEKPGIPLSPRVIGPPTFPWSKGTEQPRVIEKVRLNSPNHENRGLNPGEQLRGKEQPNAQQSRYLGVMDHCLSGHSSIVAVSRVSQQLSFESYDSSLSATSWASSNDPELANNYMTNERTTTPSTHVGQSENSVVLTDEIKLERSSQFSQEKTAKLTGQENDFSEAGPSTRSMYQKDAGKSSRKETVNATENETRKENSNNRLKTGLKILASGKEGTTEERASNPVGAKNIKGLWKRAFQTLRMDKTKKEKTNSDRRDIQSTTSEEIDPVYHLLRCAANKSQSTMTTISAVDKGTDKQKPTNESLPSKQNPKNAALKKKPPSVTFKSNNPLLDSPVCSKAGKSPTSGTVIEGSGDFTTVNRSPQLHQEPRLRSDSILGHSEEEFPSREALLAYEQHKRAVARRGALKQAKNSPSFLSVDGSQTETPCFKASEHQLNARQDPSEKGSRKLEMDPLIHSRQRPPLSNRLKSFSTEDNTDVDHGTYSDKGLAPYRKEYMREDTMNSSSSSGGPRTGIPTNLNYTTAQYAERMHPPKPRAIKLLSTKSFSLDTPGSEDRAEDFPKISGSSSPGRGGQVASYSCNLSSRTTMMRPVLGTCHNDGTVRLLQQMSGANPRERNIPHIPRVLHQSVAFSKQDWPDTRGAPYVPTLPDERISFQRCSPEFSRSSPVGRASVYTHSTLAPVQRSADIDQRGTRVNADSTFYVIRNYLPRRSDELQLRVGQYVNVLDDTDTAWWYGTCDGEQGYFPSNVLER